MTNKSSEQTERVMSLSVRAILFDALVVTKRKTGPINDCNVVYSGVHGSITCVEVNFSHLFHHSTVVSSENIFEKILHARVWLYNGNVGKDTRLNMQSNSWLSHSIANAILKTWPLFDCTGIMPSRFSVQSSHLSSSLLRTSSRDDGEDLCATSLAVYEVKNIPRATENAIFAREIRSFIPSHWKITFCSAYSSKNCTCKDSLSKPWAR